MFCGGEDFAAKKRRRPSGEFKRRAHAGSDFPLTKVEKANYPFALNGHFNDCSFFFFYRGKGRTMKQLMFQRGR
jgi:hypothetical protein